GNVVAEPAAARPSERGAGGPRPPAGALPVGPPPTLRRLAHRERRVLDLQHVEPRAEQRRDAGAGRVAPYRRVSAFSDDPPRLAWSMWKRFVAAMATIVFLTAAGSATAVLLEVDSAVDAFKRFNTPIAGVEEVLDDVDAGDPQTILVLGSDRRWGDR